MPKVFVTQIPTRRDEQTKQYAPTVNIAPAAEHGEIVIMLPPGSSIYATQDVIDSLHAHLRLYNFRDGDSIVALGDPAIIAAACAYLGKHHGTFVLLKWDRQIGRYIPTKIAV